MSHLDIHSSYESYSFDSRTSIISSKSLPSTPCELMLHLNIINQCEEIKNDYKS